VLAAARCACLHAKKLAQALLPSPCLLPRAACRGAAQACSLHGSQAPPPPGTQLRPGARVARRRAARQLQAGASARYGLLLQLMALPPSASRSSSPPQSAQH